MLAAGSPVWRTVPSTVQADPVFVGRASERVAAGAPADGLRGVETRLDPRAGRALGFPAFSSLMPAPACASFRGFRSQTAHPHFGLRFVTLSPRTPKEPEPEPQRLREVPWPNVCSHHSQEEADPPRLRVQGSVVVELRPGPGRPAAQPLNRTWGQAAFLPFPQCLCELSRTLLSLLESLPSHQAPSCLAFGSPLHLSRGPSFSGPHLPLGIPPLVPLPPEPIPGCGHILRLGQLFRFHL